MDQPKVPDEFSYFAEQFADLKVLRYNVPGFESLPLQQKKLVYYLAQAALAGRDIYWDQNYKHNLTIRRILEQIVENFTGDRSSEIYQKFLVYTKRVWFSNGIHHHYGSDKFVPEFSEQDLRDLVRNSPSQNYPQSNSETLDELINRITPVIFDPNIDSKKVCIDKNIEDKVVASAVNFYEGVTQNEVEAYYKAITVVGDKEPISYGLNSKKYKKDGKVTECTYKINGLYGQAISKITHWLRLAVTVAESDLQRAALERLIEYYVTGDLKKFDEYNILWVKDTTSVVDAISGFIETYEDPIGHNGSWESIVSIKDLDATKKFGVLSDHAQWFENALPIMPEHKKESVIGVSYKVITVVQEAGGSSPPTPIGINLPNAEWIREKHGSKSVSLGNIEYAYTQAAKYAVTKEFFLPDQQEWLKLYDDIADRLHTGLHEVIGHASGKLEKGVLPPQDTLKSYASALEEARADLVGLYFIGDSHLVDIGISPSTDIIKASYTQYIVNGLLKQLSRIDLGKNIEESHMRNRQLISQWVYVQGKTDNVIEQKDITTDEGLKTYFVINDFSKLRNLLGILLREIQRIKSQGDYDAGMHLVENFGVKVDPTLHRQVKQRWEKLKIAPYSGFINPALTPVVENDEIIDVLIDYPNDFTEQMLSYAKKHSWLPHYSHPQ